MSAESAVFTILLEEEEAGGVDLKFDIKATNHSGEEQQHLINHDIGDSLLVLGNIIQVVHGTLSTEGPPATLLVMRFEFQPEKNHRRFKSVAVRMIFSQGSNSVAGPEVYRISATNAWSPPSLQDSRGD